MSRLNLTEKNGGEANYYSLLLLSTLIRIVFLVLMCRIIYDMI